MSYQGTELEFAAPWRRLTMIDAVKTYGGPDFSRVKTDEEARELAAKLGLAEELKKKLKDCTKGDILNAAFEKYAEKNLIQPTFIMDYPTDISPLTKQKPGDPTMTERFEAFVYGREIGNAYSELNDPIVQLRALRAAGAREGARRRRGLRPRRGLRARASRWACPRRAAWASASTAS